MTGASVPVSFRLGHDLAVWCEQREARRLTGQALSSAVRTELSAWRDILAAELRRHPFTLPDLGVLADVCNGTLDGVFVGNVLAVDLDAAFAAYPGLHGKRWRTDESTLLARVHKLGPAADMAVRDAIAQWWHEEHPHTTHGWTKVGITVIENPQ